MVRTFRFALLSVVKDPCPHLLSSVFPVVSSEAWSLVLLFASCHAENELDAVIITIT